MTTISNEKIVEIALSAIRDSTHPDLQDREQLQQVEQWIIRSSRLITAEELKGMLVTLGESLPLINKLLAFAPFKQWAEHLQQDAYRRLNVRPVEMYEKVEK